MGGRLRVAFERIERGMKKTLMAILGGLLIIICGVILTVLMSHVPVGFSDGEVETIGRKFFYGLPWPCYVAEGSSSLSALGQAISHFPVNAMFWTVVVACFSCIPGRKLRWGRIIGTIGTEAVVFGVLAALIWFA